MNPVTQFCCLISAGAVYYGTGSWWATIAVLAALWANTDAGDDPRRGDD